MIDVLIAAAIALFVLSRLYVALGRDDGPPDGRSRTPVQAPSSAPQTQEPEPATTIERRPIFHGPAADGLEAIYEADNSFDPDAFRDGARAAYEMIVGAYANGDRKALKPLLDTDVYEAWDAAIKARDESGEAPFELLRVRKLEIENAELEDNVARIVVHYEAELGDGERTRRANEY
ncbi:MAG: Tim44/TimA family putative adaptor protein, partial [Pseudomonadota bacterium]